MGKSTIIRNVIGVDKDGADKREAIMELDNIRKDHLRDTFAAERADNKAQAEWQERNRR
jgi:hypothetical protein